LMSESDDGVSVTVTRQNAGRSVSAAGGALAPGAVGGTNWRDVTGCASVTFAFCRLSDAANRSHAAVSIDGVCAWSAAAHDRAHTRDVSNRILAPNRERYPSKVALSNDVLTPPA
jgi:hypothetical protein